MAAIILFDTLEYAKRARANGFTEAQAEFQAEEMAKLARSIDEQLATKQDLKELEQRLTYKLGELEEHLMYKLTVRLGGIMVAGITVLGILISILYK